MLAGISSQALCKKLTQKIEGRPRFVQGRRFGEFVIKYFVGMTMLQGKLEIGLAGLRKASGSAERSEKFPASLKAQRANDIVAITVTLVKGGSGGAGGFGDGAHGEGLFSAPGAQPARRFQDALFKLRICLSGQRLDSGVYRRSMQGPKII